MLKNQGKGAGVEGGGGGRIQSVAIINHTQRVNTTATMREDRRYNRYKRRRQSMQMAAETSTVIGTYSLFTFSLGTFAFQGLQSHGIF